MKDRPFEIFMRFGPQPSVAIPGKPGQVFYECGICGHMHPTAWDGDCRDDANRFTNDELDRNFPGWIEVDVPTWDGTE